MEGGKCSGAKLGSGMSAVIIFMHYLRNQAMSCPVLNSDDLLVRTSYLDQIGKTLELAANLQKTAATDAHHQAEANINLRLLAEPDIMTNLHQILVSNLNSAEFESVCHVAEDMAARLTSLDLYSTSAQEKIRKRYNRVLDTLLLFMNCMSGQRIQQVAFLKEIDFMAHTQLSGTDVWGSILVQSLDRKVRGKTAQSSKDRLCMLIHIKIYNLTNVYLKIKDKLWPKRDVPEKEVLFVTFDREPVGDWTKNLYNRSTYGKFAFQKKTSGDFRGFATTIIERARTAGREVNARALGHAPSTAVSVHYNKDRNRFSPTGRVMSEAWPELGRVSETVTSEAATYAAINLPRVNAALQRVTEAKTVDSLVEGKQAGPRVGMEGELRAEFVKAVYGAGDREFTTLLISGSTAGLKKPRTSAELYKWMLRFILNVEHSKLRELVIQHHAVDAEKSQTGIVRHFTIRLKNCLRKVDKSEELLLHGQVELIILFYFTGLFV